MGTTTIIDENMLEALRWFPRPWVVDVDDFENEVIISDAQCDPIVRWEKTRMNVRVAHLIAETVNALPPLEEEEVE